MERGGVCGRKYGDGSYSKNSRKIEYNPKEPEYLKVVWGIGYKMEKNKAVIGFISWFLGISILAFNVWMLFMEFSCYGGNFKKQVETVFRKIIKIWKNLEVLFQIT